MGRADQLGVHMGPFFPYLLTFPRSEIRVLENLKIDITMFQAQIIED